MLKKLERYAPSTVFVIMLLILGIPLAYYIFSWVPERKAQLTAQYLRVVQMIGYQVETRGKNLTRVIEENLEKNEIPGLKQLLDRIPGLKSEIREEKTSGDEENTKRIAFNYDHSGEVFKFKIKKAPGLPETLEVSIEKENFMKGACNRGEFDDVVIVDDREKVIFSREYNLKGMSGMGRIYPELEKYFQEKTKGQENKGQGQGKGEPGNQNKEKSNIIKTVDDIDIAQTGYKLFSQRISMATSGSLQRGDEKYWYICGLLSNRHFTGRCRRISNNILLAFLVILLLVLFAFPLAKLLLMGSRDRLKQRDLVLLVASLVFGIPLFIYLFTTGTAYFTDDDNYKKDLHALHTGIAGAFEEEISQAHRQLTALFKKIKPLGAEAAARGQNIIIKIPNTGDRVEPPYPHILFLLGEMSKIGEPAQYPYFDMLYLVDGKGNQLYKGVADNAPFSFLDVSKRNYFKLTVEDRLQEFKIENKNQKLVLDPVHSKTTAIYEINMAIPVDKDVSQKTGLLYESILKKNSEVQGEPRVAGMSFRPLSVIGPVLPHGYGFALINQMGKVIFHSNAYLNSYENFFQECVDSREIRAAAMAGARTFLTTYYQGVKRQLYYGPTAYKPWGLVVFRDIHVHDSRNMERFSLALIQYAMYIIALALLFLIYLLFGWLQAKIGGITSPKLYRKFRWLWPAPHLRLKYYWNALLNLVCVLLLLLQLFLYEHPWWFSFAVPLVLLFLSYLDISRSKIKSMRTGQSGIRNFLGHYLAPVLFSITAVYLIINFRKPLFFGFSPGRILLLLPIILAASLYYVPYAPNKGKWVINKLYQHSHTLFLYSLVTLFIVYPALSFYKYAYKDERIAAEKYYQLRLGRDYENRRTWLRDNYRPLADFLKKRGKVLVDLDPPGLYTQHNTRVKKDKDKLAGYLSERNWTVPPSLTRRNFLPPPRPGILQWISRHVPFQSQYSEVKKYLYTPPAADSPFRWHDSMSENGDTVPILEYRLPGQSPQGKEIYLVSEIPGAGIKGGLLWLVIAGIFAVFLFVTIFLFWMIYFLGKAIFLKDLHTPLEERNPVSGEVVPTPGRFIYYGTAAPSRVNKKNLDKRTYLELDCASPGDMEKFEEKYKPDISYLFLYNLGYDMYNSSSNQVKLALLEKAVTAPGLNILVFSQFEPLQHFTLPGDEKEAEKAEKRWLRVMEYFNCRYLVEKKPLTEPTLALPAELQAYLDFEVAGSEYLTPVKNKLLADLKKKGNPAITLSELKTHFYEYSNPVFDSIWKTSTREEKLVLVQLAQEGLVNRKNKSILRGLIERRLIYCSPLRLMSDGFAQYIRSAKDLGQILKWEKSETESDWSKLRRPFLFLVVGIALFLAITQPELLKSWQGLFAGLSGVVVAAFKLLDQLSVNAGEDLLE